MELEPSFDFVLKQPIWAYYIAAALLMAPLVRIFMRAGLKPYFALLVLVPYVGYVLCAAALTFQRWPVLPPKEKKNVP